MQSAGDDLISVAVADSASAQRLASRLREENRWLEVVAGINSVVVRFDIATTLHSDVEARIVELTASVDNTTTVSHPIVDIPITYGGPDGPDLASICEQLGITRDQFIEQHCGEYTVDMLGFTPGFAYIGGLDEKLDVPRLREPRTRVEAGSVGIADRRTGLYSLAGPGGWPIIGRTDVQLFDATADNPFTLVPGTRVRFVAACWTTRPQ